jgi:hypothetical protein
VARGLEQREGADDVGLHERARAGDRAIDVGLGGEVHDGVDAVLGQHPIDQRAVADVAVDERAPRRVRQVAQVLAAAGVGQRVEHHQRGLGARGLQLTDEVGADEAGAAGDQDVSHAAKA